jgi:segregation and condensation protein B
MTETEAQATEAESEATEAAEAEVPSNPWAVPPEADAQALGDVDPLRLLEALLFAATSPLSTDELRERMPDDADVGGLLGELGEMYANRGVHLVEAGGRWSFQTAADLSGYLRVYVTRTRKLSRAAVETMAIVAYHQPVTRAEIEEIRGVALSKGTFDQLFEAGWIHPKGRRETPGRPVTWATTDKFLTDFGLADLDALPGLEELKAAGLLDKRPAIQISEGLMSQESDDRLVVTPLAAVEGTLEAAEVSEALEDGRASAPEADADGDSDDAADDSDDDEFDDEDDDEFEDEDDEEEENDSSEPRGEAEHKR